MSNGPTEALAPAAPPFDRRGIVRFTVDDAQLMMREGILPEDASTELLDGLIVLKDRAAQGQDVSRHGERHSLCVSLLVDLAPQINGPHRQVRSQPPLVCGETNAPEPGLVIVRGGSRDYAKRLPHAADASCVVEVADSSYERDSKEKLAIFARAGIPQHLIVNPRNDAIEVHGDPDTASGTFGSKVTRFRGDTVTLRVSHEQALEVEASKILP